MVLRGEVKIELHFLVLTVKKTIMKKQFICRKLKYFVLLVKFLPVTFYVKKL